MTWQNCLFSTVELMVNDHFDKLDFIIGKYNRMPVANFLVYEAYLENKNIEDEGLALSIYFEVKDYNDQDAKISIIDEKPANNKDSRLTFTTLSSEVRPGYKYSILKGSEVAERASRLKSFLLTYYIQPPGILTDGTPHFGFDIQNYTIPSDKPSDYKNKINCKQLSTCLFKTACPKHRAYKISRLNYGSSASSHIKVLQNVLFKFGFGDEMRFEKYKTDGKYGIRTKLALSSLIKEINFMEQKDFLPRNGERVTAALAKEIKKKCEQGWYRKKYYHFTNKKWDIKPLQKKTELSWLKWRHHVKQLQNDLKYFTVTRMDFLPYRNMENPINVNIDEKWEKGIFDEWTETAVRQFQDAALAGSRYDPINEVIFDALSEPTYKGEITGRVDSETKREIKRWFDFIENVIEVKDLYIKDEVSASLDLSGTKIISPMLASGALTKEDGDVEVLLAVPDEVESVKTNAENIRENLPFFLFIHRPANNERPFLYDDYYPSHNYEDKYFVGDVEKVENPESLQLYKGTKGRPKKEEFTAEFIAEDDEEPLKEGHDGAPISAYNEKIKEKIRKNYDRQYKGIVEVLNDKNLNLWKVNLVLSNKVKDGMYLLRIKSSDDLKPHPVRVFSKKKEQYNIIHLTDLHVAARYDEVPFHIDIKSIRYNNPNDRIRDILSRIKNNEIPADIVIITGDAVDNANDHRPYDAKSGEYIYEPIYDKDENWRLLHYMLTTDPGINVPVYICLGNHDFKPNPTSIQNLTGDLNLSDDDAELYPYDNWDGGVYKGEAVEEWIWWDRCYGDYLYADENAVQYYFENLCPFTDFSIKIDDLNLIFMNSGHDDRIFFADYGVEDIGLFYQIVTGHNPAPKSVGFDESQLKWLDTTLRSNDGKTNIFCMHSALVSPPSEKMVPNTGVPAFSENEITGSIKDYNDSSIIKGRDKLIEYVEKGKIKIVITGHTHVNLELRCDPSSDPVGWYVGKYSEYKMDLEHFNEKQNRLIISTISTGMVGCVFDLEFRDYFEPFSDSDIERIFSHTGYRTIRIKHDGELVGFEGSSEWYKYEGI